MADASRGRVVRGLRGLRDWAELWKQTAEFQAAAEALEAAGGRPLTADVLVSTGVAAMAASGHAGDWTLAVDQLWDHQTRAEARSLTAVSVDIPQRVIPDGTRIGDWRVWCPDADGLAALAPVPAAAPWLGYDPWPAEAVTRHALLVRDNGHVPAGRLVLRLPPNPWAEAWLPLTVLNAYGAAVSAPALFDVVAGARVTRHGEGVHVEWEPVPGPGGDEEGEWARPYLGRFAVRDVDRERFTRYCQALVDRYDQLAAAPAARRLAERFERAARQFVAANDASWPDGTADDPEDVALHYMIALEGLLSNVTQEVTRVVGDRAALLCADTPAEAVRTRELLRAVYRSRSRYVHGDEPPEVDLPALRNVARRAVVRWLAAAAVWAGRDLSARAMFDGWYGALDDALFVPALRKMLVDRPVAQLRSAVDVPLPG